MVFVLPRFSDCTGGALYATGVTFTDTLMRCPPDPRITPSTGATSV
jgi:hypothetical protein